MATTRQFQNEKNLKQKTEKRMLTKAYLQRSIQDPLNVHQQVSEEIRQENRSGRLLTKQTAKLAC